MTVRPLILPGHDVLALRDRRKFQHRTVLKLANELAANHERVRVWCDGDGQWWLSRRAMHTSTVRETFLLKPPFAVDDVCYVKEAWRASQQFNHLPPRKIPGGSQIVCEADRGEATLFGKYRHARFMPRRLSRACMVLTDVRVEQVQSISWADCLAEGFDPETDDGPLTFAEYWNTLHARDGYDWQANPWCCVLVWETVIHENVDAWLKEQAA